jgi:hypothetical protein
MTETERYQRAWHLYEEKHGHLPSSARESVEWAVEEGLIGLSQTDPYDALAGKMASALRAEYRTDGKGRRYRVNHAIRVTKSGVQYTFWAEMGYAPYEHMEKAFGQRRNQIVGDCGQLKTDVDVYNEMTGSEYPPIQMVLDFTDDVAEREALQQDPSLAA